MGIGLTASTHLRYCHPRATRAGWFGNNSGADNEEDLHQPPGNRLESLRGSRAGQNSIRVNDQFRVCFRWTAAGPEDVEIVDYH